MAIEVGRDPTPGFWRLAARGARGGDDAGEVLDVRDWQGKHCCRWDLRGLEKGPETTEEIREAVDLTESNRTPSVGSRTAILVSDDLRFGLGRMFTSSADGIEGDFRIFRDEEAAVDWLFARSIDE